MSGINVMIDIKQLCTRPCYSLFKVMDDAVAFYCFWIVIVIECTISNLVPYSFYWNRKTINVVIKFNYTTRFLKLITWNYKH